MSNLWLPPQTDLALALREPNLLVPGKKPAGEVRLKNQPYAPKNAWSLGSGFGRYNDVTLSAGVTEAVVQGEQCWYCPDDAGVFGNNREGLSLYAASGDSWAIGARIFIPEGTTLLNNDRPFTQVVFFSSKYYYYGAVGPLVETGKWVNAIAGCGPTGRFFAINGSIYSASYSAKSLRIGVELETPHIGGAGSLLAPAMYGNLIAFWNPLPPIDVLREFSLDMWALFEPANDTPYLFSVPSGGGTSYTLTASSGSFALTGNTAGLLASRKLSTSVGTFTWTGQDAGLAAGRVVHADSGAFALTGNSVSIFAALTMPAQTAAYALTGNDASLVYAGGTAPTLSNIVVSAVQHTSATVTVAVAF